MYICIYKKKHLRSRKGLLKTFVLRSALILSLYLSHSLSPDRRLHPLRQYAFSRFFPSLFKEFSLHIYFLWFFLFPFYPPPPKHHYTYIYYILEIFSRPFQPSSSSVRSAHSFRSLPRAPSPAYIAVALQSSGQRPGDFLLFIIYPGVPA